MVRQTFQPPGTAPVFTQPPPHGPLTGAAASSAPLKVNEGWKGAEGVGGVNRFSARRQDSGDKPVAVISCSGVISCSCAGALRLFPLFHGGYFNLRSTSLNSLRDPRGGWNFATIIISSPRAHAAFTTAVMTFWAKLVKRSTGTASGGGGNVLAYRLVSEKG